MKCTLFWIYLSTSGEAVWTASLQGVWEKTNKTSSLLRISILGCVSLTPCADTSLPLCPDEKSSPRLATILISDLDYLPALLRAKQEKCGAWVDFLPNRCHGHRSWSTCFSKLKEDTKIQAKTTRLEKRYPEIDSCTWPIKNLILVWQYNYDLSAYAWCKQGEAEQVLSLLQKYI